MAIPNSTRRRYNPLTVRARASAVALCLLGLFVAEAARAQELVDASFCRAIQDKQCVGLITNGGRVSIEELATTRDAVSAKSYRTIYLWASTFNRSERLVAFLVARTGECYASSSEASLRGAHESIANSWVSSARDWLANHSLAEIWQFLGLSSLKGGDISLKLATTQASERYRVFDFRYVHCPGEFSFLVVGSDGIAIPPPKRNFVRTVTITR